MRARYAGFTDANGSSPGGDLARDADALRPPHLASPYAIRVSRRADNRTRTCSLRSGVGISFVTSADYEDELNSFQTPGRTTRSFQDSKGFRPTRAR
jgi:hypothetical protein